MDMNTQLLKIANEVGLDLEESKKKGKKKPYDSVTYTTGDLQKNIDHFNKCLTGKANNDNSKGPLPDYVFAKGADGSSSIPSSAATSGEGASAGASAGGEGGGMGESLEINEAKRYVRRYYMRPQDIFCSNKAEILKALIDHQDEDCTIYTLNNLGDNKDVHKLTNDDIIYYYDDGILYDKNHVRIMDYDLYIKHEEERDNINPEQVSDAKFQDVYDDRMTDQTVVEELNEAADFVKFEDKKAFNKKWALALTNGSENGKIPGYKDSDVTVTVFTKNPGKQRKSKEFPTKIMDFVLNVDGDICIACEVIGKRMIWNINGCYMEVPFKNDKNMSYKLTVGPDLLKRLDTYKLDRRNAINGMANKGAKVVSDLSDLEKMEAKEWLRDNIISINFVIPCGDSGETEEDGTVGGKQFKKYADKFSRLNSEFRSLFPATSKIRDGEKGSIGKNINVEFKWAADMKQKVLSYYDFVGKEAITVLRKPISQMPQAVRAMLDAAKSTQYSIEHGAKDSKDTDKEVNSFPFAMAILELFNYDLDFLAHYSGNAEMHDEKAEETEKNEEFNLAFESVDVHGNKLTEAKEDTCVICGEKINGYGNNAEPYKKGRCCDACNIKFVLPSRFAQLNNKEEK